MVAIGNAPTALFRLMEEIEGGAPMLTVILGFPVGFIGAAESKDALADTDLPQVTLLGRRGQCLGGRGGERVASPLPG